MRGENMETKNLEAKLIQLSKNYLSIQKAFLTHIISNNYLNFSNPFIQFCFDVENAFYSLPSPLRKIINNEFFYQDFPEWWKSIYSKKHFTQLKKIAIYKFMEAYGEIK